MRAVSWITCRRAKGTGALATTVLSPWTGKWMIRKALARALWTSYKWKSAMTPRFGSGSRISWLVERRESLWHEQISDMAGQPDWGERPGAPRLVRECARRSAVALRLGKHAGLCFDGAIRDGALSLDVVQSEFP